MSVRGAGRHIDEDDLVALALGQLTGHQRADALSHVESCTRCGAALDEFSAAADGVLELAPELDPPLGFEVRVLEAMAREPRRTFRHHHRHAIAAIAASLAILAGIGIGRFAIPTGNPTRAPYASIASTHVQTVALRSSDAVHGTVALFRTAHPWVAIAVTSAGRWRAVVCDVETTSGTRKVIGRYTFTDGRGTWSAPLPMAVGKVRAVILSAPNGTVLATAPIYS